MRIVVQRVSQAQVKVDGEVCGSIGKGILVFLAVHKDDASEDTQWLVNKLITLRIFSDENGKMNLSVQDVGGEVLVVSQFTLYGNCMNGRRPDFIDTAPPAAAQFIYNKFVEEVKQIIGKVQTGRFAASMEVSLINDGPVTFIIDNK